jgi:hypothetical protein
MTMFNQTPPAHSHERWPSPPQHLHQAILDQIDVLYPVALKLTHSAESAQDLTERTVLASMRDQEVLLANQRSLKFAMLALLRQHHVSRVPDLSC